MAVVINGTTGIDKVQDGSIVSADLDTNIAVAGTLGVTGISTFQKDVNIGATTPTNLISNSEFATNTTGWAASGSSLAIVSNQLQLTPNSGVNGFANQQVSGLVVGRSYIASVDVTVDAGALSRLYIGTAANGSQTLLKLNLGVGTHSFSFIATQTTHHFALAVGGGTGQVTRFDNAKLTEVSKLIFTAGTGVSPEIKQGNSVNDLAIATSAVNRIHVSGNGEVTMPGQPCFSATASTSNIPLSTATVVTLSSERFDVGNNLSSNTFTAPVTGKYLFTYLFYFTQLDASHTTLDCHILTSNKQYQITFKPSVFMNSDGNFSATGSIIADMDENDTTVYKVYVAGGTAQTDIHADSHVSGCLLF